jgi:uncharacterized protein
MRLASEISKALSLVVESRLSPSPGSELFLFGSRADPDKKGGDIDLLLVTNEETKKKSQSFRLELRSALREAAGDQKVDLSIATSEERLSDPFFSSISNPISLKKW